MLLQTLVALLQEFSSTEQFRRPYAGVAFEVSGGVFETWSSRQSYPVFERLKSHGYPSRLRWYKLGNVLTVIGLSSEFIRSSRSVYFSKRRKHSSPSSGAGLARRPSSPTGLFLSVELKTILISIYSAVRFDHEELRT